MSYQDLEEARAKRIEKEKAAEEKAARGRKRKAPAPVNVPEPKTDVIQPSEASSVRTPVGLTMEIPGPWRAPVAQMIPKNYRGGSMSGPV